MSSEPKEWARKYYEPGGGDAFLFYTVFGDFGDLQQEFRLARSKYRSNGIPEGVDLWGCRKPGDAAYMESYLEAPIARELEENSPELFGRVKTAPACIIVRGNIPDPETLDYLRDVVGLLTYLLDQGGVAILDLLALQWWAPEEWLRRIYEPDAPVPTHHVTILVSDEEKQEWGTWVHTRGMRKFGRPDLSIHRVRPEEFDAIIDLFNRFIVLQAFGHVIPEGEEIRMAGLPPGMTCHHGGDMEDLDFNNVHVEIRWPNGDRT